MHYDLLEPFEYLLATAGGVPGGPPFGAVGAFPRPVRQQELIAGDWDPAVALERLTELSGSVRLTERARSVLSLPAPPLTVAPAFACEQVRALSRRVHEHLADLDRAAEVRLFRALAPKVLAPAAVASLSRGRYDTVDASELRALLQELDWAAAPSWPRAARAKMKAIEAGARELAVVIAGPQRALFVRNLKIVRGELHVLRRDIASVFVPLGGAFAQLCMLDEVVEAATGGRTGALFVRVMESVEACLARVLARALEEAATPGEVAELVDGWYEPAGPVVAHGRAAGEAGLALLRLEVASVRHLVQAGANLASALSSDNAPESSRVCPTRSVTDRVTPAWVPAGSGPESMTVPLSGSFDGR